jgi:hypothetical protein
MKSEQCSSPKRESAMMKSLSKPAKIILILFSSLVVLVFVAVAWNFVYCDTVAICDSRPTMSPEMVATQMPIQYEYAIQDINAGRFEIAKQRLEYIIYHTPEYPGAREKLAEVEKMLKLTPVP